MFEEATAEAVFEEQRRHLVSVAYRMLGSVADAEDVVQEAYLRWARTDRATIRDPRAFLATVVSRLALDQLRSARATREVYPGPWLPEPVATGSLGPLDTAELRESVSYAALHLMERLTPPERAVFVLREAFGLPYDDIAEILDMTAGACRQLRHRAGRRLEDGPGRFQASGTDHAKLLERFLAAAATGDLAALSNLLSDDVVAYNDGGGRVRAALRPIFGREKVLAFVAGLVSRYPGGVAQVGEANGEPVAWTSLGGGEQLVTLGVRGGRIHAIFVVLNPAKLTHARADVTS